MSWKITPKRAAQKTGSTSERDGYYKVTGRTSEVINVAGLKFMASEVERVALQFDGVELAKAEGKPNPITGQHVELNVRPGASA